MSGPVWMPLYLGDYLKDTGHLSTLEHGAYLLLILHYWTHGKLPEEDAQLARICRLTAYRFKRIRATLQEFFHDGWKHKRIDEELARTMRISEARSQSGQKRGRKLRLVSSNDTPAKPLENNNPTEAIACPHPHPHVPSTDTLVEEAARARDFADPVACYSEGELAALKVKFHTTDIEARIRSYWPWCEKRGIKRNEDRKSAFWSTLQKELDASSLLKPAENRPASEISPQLASSRLMRKADWQRRAV